MPQRSIFRRPTLGLVVATTLALALYAPGSAVAQPSPESRTRVAKKSRTRARSQVRRQVTIEIKTQSGKTSSLRRLTISIPEREQGRLEFDADGAHYRLSVAHVRARRGRDALRIQLAQRGPTSFELSTVATVKRKTRSLLARIGHGPGKTTEVYVRVD